MMLLHYHGRGGAKPFLYHGIMVLLPYHGQGGVKSVLYLGNFINKRALSQIILIIDTVLMVQVTTLLNESRSQTWNCCHT